MNNEPKKIHYMTHNFSDWDSDTKHMTRNQRAIYLDLRTLYFTTAHKNNGSLSDDLPLLYFRLACHSDIDKADLDWLLKDKFKKIGKTYRHRQWDKQVKDIHFTMRNAGENRNAKGNGGNSVGVTLSNADSNVKIYDNTNGFVMTGAERTEKSRKLKALKNQGVQADKFMSLDKIRTLFDAYIKHSNTTPATPSNDECNADGNGSNTQIRENNHNPLSINQNIKNHECVNSETLHAHTSFSKNLKLKSIKDWQAPSVDMVNQFLAKAGFDRQLSHDEFTTIFDKFINYNVSRELQGNFLATEQVRMDKLIDWIKREKPSYHTATTPASEISVPRTPFDKNTMIKLGFSYYPCFDNHTPAETMQIIKDHKKAGETNLETYERIKQTGVANCQKNTPASHEFVHALLSKKPKTTGATA